MVVIGTAQGDLHDIGKNLVAMMLEGAGFKVVNLGRDVAPEKFVAAVEEHAAHIVGISALDDHHHARHEAHDRRARPRRGCATA